MTSPEPLASLSRAELLALVAELQRQIAVLTVRLEALQAENERLQRGAKRQAAPFSKGTRVAEPKPPGRKPGTGNFRYREAPQPEELTASPVEVPVTHATCPACGGRLVAEGVECASITDLPAMPHPQVTLYWVAVRQCAACGTQVRGRHPHLALDQYGATAHRLGPRLVAAAHVLHYGVGIPTRKVPDVLQVLTGVRLTQGALTQDALRRAQGRIGAAYAQLRAQVQASPMTHTDDTGWRVGGQPAHLMVFETAQATIYQIRDRHRNEEVREVLPAGYPGVMITDRGRSYDARELDGVRQQKCLAHIQRALSDVLATKTGRAREFAGWLKHLLQGAMQVWRAYHDGQVVDFAAKARHLMEAITAHLRDRRLKDPDNQRLLDELGWHHDRGNLLRFLTDPRIDPTNNRAERALRPAVIARKVSQCSKNARGAEAFAAFTSVIRTLMKTEAGSVVEALAQLLRPIQPQHVPT